VTEPVLRAARSGSIKQQIIHQTEVIAVLLQVAFSRYDHINGAAQADQMLIDPLCRMPAVGTIGHNNQDIDVALGSHVTASRGAEQDDLPWVGDFDNTSHEVVEDFRAGCMRSLQEGEHAGHCTLHVYSHQGGWYAR
jgi:hypothetical protein